MNLGSKKTCVQQKHVILRSKKKDLMMVKSVLGLFTFLHCAKQKNMIKLFYPHTTASCCEADHKKHKCKLFIVH